MRARRSSHVDSVRTQDSRLTQHSPGIVVVQGVVLEAVPVGAYTQFAACHCSEGICNNTPTPVYGDVLETRAEDTEASIAPEFPLFALLSYCPSNAKHFCFRYSPSASHSSCKVPSHTPAGPGLFFWASDLAPRLSAPPFLGSQAVSFGLRRYISVPEFKVRDPKRSAGGLPNSSKVARPRKRWEVKVSQN